MGRRLRKQLAILAVLAVFFGGIGALIAAVVYEPPPPPPPPPPTYADLVVVSTHVFRAAPDHVDLLAIVKNPNAHAGVRAVPYTFTVQAGGSVSASLSGETYFLPGQEKSLVVLHAAVPPEATWFSVTFGEPVWVPVRSDFRAPSLPIVSRRGHVRDGDDAVYELKGELTNESDLDFRSVDVTVVGFDAAGAPVGVGRTFLGSLRALERREFTVSWPLPPGVVVVRTREVAEVNVFSPAAVEPRGGIPGLEPGPTPLPLRR